MESTAKASLQGLKIVAFESRRAQEMAELIRRYGGIPIVAPSMREIPLSENRAAMELLSQLEAGKFGLLIFMTGVGTRALNQALRTQYPQDRITAALAKTTLVARGPKPVAALKELGLAPAITVPEPNTWREIVTTLAARLDLRGKRIAVQEYGIANPHLVDGLKALGASITTIPIYRWALPQELGPLRGAISQIIRGDVAVVLFTNGAQVKHLFQVAAADKNDTSLRSALKNLAVGSVGPICTQALKEFGVERDIEPVHPKMGALLADVATSARRLLDRRGFFK